MKNSPPFQDLAFPEFKRQFGDLFSVRARVEDYEYGMVVGVMNSLFLMNLEPGDHKHWERTVRAAHYYLDRGALKSARAVSEAYMRIVDDIPLALNRVVEKRLAADKAGTDDARIEANLSLYKTLYEGLMTLLVAPVIVGFSLTYNSKSKEFTPKPDGRVNLRAIESMEKWMLYPSNHLKEGLNAHVRNAFSHERYRILDGGRVEMWDEDHRGRPTWGPEVWALSKLEALCQRLHLTSLAVVAALVLFGANYRQLIADRGWVPQGLRRQPLRMEQAQQIMENYAEYNGFLVSEFDRDGGTLRMGLQTQHRGIDQEEEIIVGGEGWGRVYKKPVKYEQLLVAEQVVGIIQRAAHNMEDVSKFSVTVKNEYDKDIGQFVITRAALQNVRGPSGQGIAEDRRHAESDSLGGSRMWVKIESEVTPAARRPKNLRQPGLILPK